MARIYSKKFGTDYKKLMEKFWGEHFYDAKTKKFTDEPNDSEGKSLKRCFVQFVMDPICKLANAVMDGNKEVTNKILDTLEIKLSSTDKELAGKHLLKAIMSQWINAADTILEMMIVHLPSPKVA